MVELPVVDVAALVDPSSSLEERRAVGAELDAACRTCGFLLVAGHGVDPALRADLERLAREFFALPDEEKARIAMPRAGTAWRGWFPVGGELTSGEPDRKEGVYFGTELPADDPRVRSGTPLHGANLFPERPAELGPVVLRWIDEVSALGAAVLRGLALGLGLDEDWFARTLTADPTILFRAFHYPPGDGGSWGVGEHTDYGLITLLAQDHHGGLQVRSQGEWIDVPADPELFVVNIGDMLDRMTRGRYRSDPHRVRNLSGQDRVSFPLFVDPSWDARVVALPDSVFAGEAPADDAGSRWDGASVHAWEGPYGDYLTAKVARVFPDLFAEVT
ncbi:MAG TPA: 2-oxoglutarate and iron-dependent oxygenase domain-containing protein [Candidatus Nanopelagicales bacterium]|nr:2-oxoglutarate and iron-dependent oxygenase domain-containing protein [Candidatus Nanopelagicales bacterium]